MNDTIVVLLQDVPLCRSFFSELLEEAIAQGLSLNQIRERVKGDQPPSAGEDLQTRMKETYKLAKKLKVWNNPKKRKKLEALLEEIELLLFED